MGGAGMGRGRAPIGKGGSTTSGATVTGNHQGPIRDKALIAYLPRLRRYATAVGRQRQRRPTILFKTAWSVHSGVADPLQDIRTYGRMASIDPTATFTMDMVRLQRRPGAQAWNSPKSTMILRLSVPPRQIGARRLISSGRLNGPQASSIGRISFARGSGGP